MNQDIPRRIRIDLFTPEEKALFDMVGEIEKLGAHPLLTDCVVLLGDARGKLSDWVDLQAAEQSVQSDGALPSVEEVICPICQSIVRLYDGNKVGMHTPHSNVNEPICKMVGSEITPRR